MTSCQSSGNIELLTEPSSFARKDGSARLPKLSVEHVQKSYRVDGRIITALDDVSLHVAEGEFVTVIGPSGCGKSTLFHVIAGLQAADSGVIRFDGVEAVDPSPIASKGGRPGRAAYMFQKDLLLPWRRLLDNVVLAQEITGVPRAQSYAEARPLLPLFGLEGFERSFPSELSGGMRQRAALLRTFLAHRDLMLLDEPFGALDALTRAEMQCWLVEVWERFQQTILFITHDVEEAVFLSDRVYVMAPRPGHIVEELGVSLPRPRPRSVVSSTEFVRLREHLLAVLFGANPQAIAPAR